MRIYEELFIIRPDAVEEEIDAYVEQVKNIITDGKGTVEKLEKWGNRKLAYKVRKYSEGYYVLIQFSCNSELPKEIERRLRVSDLVIKFVTVRIDEKLKKLEKRAKQREKRAKRKPKVEMPAPAAPGVASVPGAPAPAGPTPGAPAPGAPAPSVPAPSVPPAPAPVEAAPEAAPATPAAAEATE
jgi:small subunit ribosomal protein S6